MRMITHTTLTQTLRELRLLAPLMLVTIAGAAAAPDAESSSVRHPNLLLNPAEISAR